MKTVLKIENLDCPVCAEALQSELQKIKGVVDVQVEYITQTITLSYENETALQKVIAKANKFEDVRVLDGGVPPTKRKNTHTKAWMCIVIAALFFVGGTLLEYLARGTLAEALRYVLYALAYLSVGYPVLISTAKNLVKGRVFDENFLMTVASVGAIALGEFGEGVLVMLLYQLGELLQSIAVGSSRNSVAELMELKSEYATVVVDGVQRLVPPEELSVGDVVLVKAGERVPADGILLSEIAALDVKSLTGEADLRMCKTGDELLSGSINAGGVYEMKITRPYKDSAVSRILDMVENASSGKAAPEKFIAKFARIYTPAVCIFAVLLAVCAPLCNGLIADNRLYFKNVDVWIRSALTFLVISCPCALVISVPLTYFSGIGTCAKQGILVKGATYLDVVAKTRIAAFDKTGTLTEGNFTVCGVRLAKHRPHSENELLSLVAAVESGSSHPIARAFASVPFVHSTENVSEYAGQGMSATVCGKNVLVGNETLLRSHGISVEKVESVYTLVHVAEDGEYLGAVEIGDKLRENAKTAVAALKQQGVLRSVMLTGDSAQRAQSIAEEVGIDETYVQLLPDEKHLKAKELKKAGVLLYVGDGINDAPVMMAADCAVSMGTLGSAAAIEASDMVLISDDLTALPKALRVAKKTRRIVLQNIIFSIAMKVAFMVLGAGSILPLWLAVFADVGVMLLAVCNSFRVRSKK